MTTLALPTHHLDKALLPEAARRDFDHWCEHLEPIFAMKRGRRQALAEVAKAMNLDFKAVNRKFYRALAKGGIAGLRDNRLAGPRYWKTKSKSLVVSDDDQELIKFYCECNQRSSRAAVKQLRRDWVKRKPTTAMQTVLGADGFEKVRALLVRERPIDPRTGMPRGWSIDNLIRYAPTTFELKATRIGRSAAASEAQLVYTTRKKLWVGSHYQLDDMWHDLFVNTFAEKQAGRPLELFTHDLYSARKVRWGIRVRTRKEDGKSYNQLTERMTRYVIAATLFLDGYSPRGTVLVLEHGTATLGDHLLRELHKISGGLITASLSGMTGATAHAGQYPGLVRGNPRHKASLESSNNLTHNVFASLPGQTGKDVEHRPEQLDGGIAKLDKQGNCIREAGLLHENAALLAAYDQLSPERAELLRFPILELNQFHAVAEELYAAMENDPDHDLEGWDENTVQELSLAGQWVNQAELLKDPAQAELALSLINAGKLLTRPRKMSRREVWNRGAGQLVRLPGYGVCAILGDDLAEERTVSGDRFEFRDKEVGPGMHRYDAVAVTPYGERLQLRDGEKYQTFVNPFAPQTLFVRRADGSYIGECAQITKVCPTDVEALQRACGTVARRQSELLAPVRARHQLDAKAKRDRQANNVEVLSGQPITFAERCRAIDQKQRVRSIDDFLSSPSPVVEEEESSL